MTDSLGGRVAPAAHREFGHAMVHVTASDATLFASLPDELRVWASHGDYVEAAPDGFAVVATSANAPVAAIQDPSRRLYGLLFHPEVAHTDRGLEILRNFAFGVCGCTGDWTMASFIDEATARIRAQVGEGRVICALSGGVDSTVAAVIIHRAIGDRLTCVFVDNGVLRLNEATQIRQRFAEKLKLPLEFVDAADLFIDKLAGVTDPERKRKIIGQTFIEVFEEKAARARHLRLPRARHPLSGRDRIGLGGGSLGGHQEPPQRRRPAREDEVQAGRAVARAVQGRGAAAGPRSGPGRRVRRAPAVSRSRAGGSPARARSPGRGWTCCARPTRS